MTVPIHGLFQRSKALTRLGRHYGSGLQNMPQTDLLAIIGALADACRFVANGEDSNSLAVIADDEIEHEFELGEEMLEILDELDEELDGLDEGLTVLQSLVGCVHRSPGF